MDLNLIRTAAAALADPHHAEHCPACNGTEVEEVVQSKLAVLDNGDGPVMEIEVRCAACKTTMGWWAHGYWDPHFRQEELRRKSIRWRLTFWLIDTYEDMTRRFKWQMRRLRKSMGR